MKIRTFDTYEAAQKVADEMKGWTAKVKKTKHDEKFYISCNGVKYLCEDGYVR